MSNFESSVTSSLTSSPLKRSFYLGNLLTDLSISWCQNGPILSSRRNFLPETPEVEYAKIAEHLWHFELLILEILTIFAVQSFDGSLMTSNLIHNWRIFTIMGHTSIGHTCSGITTIFIWAFVRRHLWRRTIKILTELIWRFSKSDLEAFWPFKMT